MVSWEHILFWFVLYTVIAMLLERRGVFSRNVSISGPMMTIRSQMGLSFIEKWSKKLRTPLRIWGTAGAIIASITAIISVVFVSLSVQGMLTRPDQVQIEGPSDMLVVPGVNRFLPLSAAPEIILGLLIGMIVHEAGHAFLCRVGDINVRSTGVFLAAMIPLGAFVEPDEGSAEEASLRAQLRMFSAGIMNNFALFFITVGGLFLIVSMFIAPASGIGVAGVYDDSPADEMGISEGDHITSVDNTTIETEEELEAELAKGATTVTLNGETTVDVPRGVFVTQVPEELPIEPGERIVTVDGDTVDSSTELQTILESHSGTHISVTLESGETVEFPIGAYVTTHEDGIFGEHMELETGSGVVVHEIEGERVTDDESVNSVLDQNSGDDVTVTYDVDGEVTETTISVPESGFMVVVSDSVSGMTVSQFGIQPYPVQTFYNLLTPGNTVLDTIGNMLALLFLPIGSLAAGMEMNFPGFTPFIQQFYVVEGLPSALGWGVFFSSSVLFWTAWINFNLALFNCIPTFALDGGHILHASTEMVLGNRVSDAMIGGIVLTVKSVVLLILLSLIFGPLFL